MNSQLNSKKKQAYKFENLRNELDLIIREPKKIDENELYLFSPDVLSFHNIVLSTKRSLHTLVVIRQFSITSLHGISELSNLRELWVVECSLKDISDLQTCCKLQMLYLYSNNISQIPNMSNSPELKLLSLSNNNFSKLQNFHSMPKLQELYMANNKIKIIGDAFCKNTHLSLINLAGNPLYELKDIRNFSSISSLRSIALADPMYGECPLVSLFNYRYFMVYYLPSLSELDYYSISNEERFYVTEFFKSKMMLYDMLNNKYVNDFTKSLKDGLKESRQRISEFRKEIYLTKLQQLRIAASKKADAQSREFSFHKILQELHQRVDVTDASDKRWIDNSRINLQILQRQLSLKLEHCENMDFVEYRPGDGNKLVNICQDMCNNSLCQSVRDDLGITKVYVHQVTKVINNEIGTLRSCVHYRESINQDLNKLDSKLFQFLVKPVGVVEFQKWPFDIFEQEFFDMTEILTSDCLAAADADWIRKILAERRFLPTPLCSFSEHRLAVLVQFPVSTPTVTVESPDNYHAMHANYNRNTCCCLCINKPDLVKPVFVVEYEYIFQNKSETDATFQKLCTKGIATNLLNVWTHLNFENLGRCLNLTELEIHKLRAINLSGQGICTIDSTKSLPNLRELYLSFNKLTSLPHSTMLKYVRKLDVSFNDIRTFDMAACLPLLESFNAAWNLAGEFLTVLQMLEIYTPNLTTLNLKHNPFTDVIEIESMFLLARNSIPLLKSFDDNTMENFIDSRSVNHLPWIIDVYEKADEAMSKIPRNSMASVISEIHKSLTSPLCLVGIELKDVQYINLSNNQLSCVEFVKDFPELRELHLENNLFVKIFLEKPVNQMTKLRLNGNFILTLEGLTQENLPVLNYLDLSNNLIASLLAMGTFNSLTQFYCFHNRICELQAIYNLKNWHGLKIIDMSNNPIDSMGLCNKFIIFHIPKIEYVGGKCVTASDLLEANNMFRGSLNKDTIMNISNLGDLTQLTQLSIVNCMINQVNLTADLLPNLKSLDLTQNQITTLWGLHTLKKLQVLCLSWNKVETSVQNYRKDLVPMECFFPSLNTLFLDYNGIKSLVDLNFQDMPALKYLYMQHNALQDMDGLQKCTNLENVVLDYNKIHMTTEEDFHIDNNIKVLLLENNRIKFLSFAERLSKIIKLFFSSNKLADKNQLKYLSKLEHLREITILGNPICKRTNHYKLAIQTLVKLTHIDGHSVILEDYSDT